MIEELVLTTKEVVERLKSGEPFVMFEGSFEQYVELLEQRDVRPQFFQNEIFCTMSYATSSHERLVSNIITHLNIVYMETDCAVLGSNRPLFAKKCKAWFEADAMLVCGEEESHPLKGTMTALLNPKIIVEVHSDSTRNYDLGRKLDCYKLIPSVQYIIYIESNMPKVSLLARTTNQNEWLNNDFRSLDEAFPVNGGFISMKQLYNKVL
jgi:Uma2 family endonuclease